MSQEAIIKFLKKQKSPVGIKELLIALPYNRATISVNCKKLRKSKEIKYSIIKTKASRKNKFVYYL
jgi:predicted transcriptional regulator